MILENIPGSSLRKKEKLNIYEGNSYSIYRCLEKNLFFQGMTCSIFCYSPPDQTPHLKGTGNQNVLFVG